MNAKQTYQSALYFPFVDDKTRNCSNSVQRVSLEAGATWSVEARAGWRLQCEGSVLWVTQSNDSHDYLLHQGESFCTNERSKIVVQALEMARSGSTPATQIRRRR